MDLIHLLLVIIVICVVVGVVLWLINRFIPMEPQIKQVMNAAAVIVLVIVLVLIALNLVFSNVHIPNVMNK